MRALKCPGSRHAILRFRFNHLKASIIADTLPKVMELCFPGVHLEMNKTDWVAKLPNGSEIWFGGLDDKQRTEKILGQEYATIYLNECSQISFHARNTVRTRLAQKTSLALKFYYDCNPPPNNHWTYRLFVEKRDPDSKQPLSDPQNYTATMLHPRDNVANVADDYIKELEALPEKMRRRFLDGQFIPAVEGALWTFEILDQGRTNEPPQMQKIVIAVDPSGCSGDEDFRSDEVGIIVAGLGDDGLAYILEDLSGRFGPKQWGDIVGSAFDRHAADVVVGEINYGGAMVEQTIQTSRPSTPFRSVTASRGKHIRAEPVAALYETGKVRHVGRFEQMEEQLLGFTTSGYSGDRSPDRADAAIWAINELFPALTRKEQTGFKRAQFKRASSAGGWMR